MLKLPGLIDPHVHFREPGATHKEDWDTGTLQPWPADYNGIGNAQYQTSVSSMRNSQPCAYRRETGKARCDYGQYVARGPDNADVIRCTG